jgi:plasmid stability protein
MSQREQQTARINVDDATWQALRIRAIRANRSVADELARLVRNDLRRAGLPVDPAGSSSGPSAAEVQKPRGPAPTEVATKRARRGRPRQRLADLDLLTELPYCTRSPVAGPSSCCLRVASTSIELDGRFAQTVMGCWAQLLRSEGPLRR